MLGRDRLAEYGTEKCLSLPWNWHCPRWGFVAYLVHLPSTADCLTCLQQTLPHHLTACAWLSKHICPLALAYMIESGELLLNLFFPALFSALPPVFLLCILWPAWQNLTKHFHLDARLHFLLWACLFCRSTSLTVDHIYSTFIPRNEARTRLGYIKKNVARKMNFSHQWD